MSIADVNAARHPVRALEQLPIGRQRYALAFSLAHRFDRATLRGSERVYGDSWGVVASTTDALFLYDVTDWLRVWPHGRFHVQRGADFWQLAYGVRDDGGSITLPRHRTGDRELGPLHSITGGAGLRLRVSERPDWGVTLVGDAIYTSFDNHLFATQRIGAFGALGVEGTL